VALLSPEVKFSASGALDRQTATGTNNSAGSWRQRGGREWGENGSVAEKWCTCVSFVGEQRKAYSCKLSKPHHRQLHAPAGTQCIGAFLDSNQA